MKIDQLDAIELDAMRELIREGTWTMLVVHGGAGSFGAMEQLIDDECPSVQNYKWFRAELGGPVAEWVRDGYALEPGAQFVILSHYEGKPDCWVLDDLEGRFAEDLNELMDDHASYIEMEGIDLND